MVYEGRHLMILCSR